MKNLFLTGSLVATLFFVSCSSDDDQPIVQNTVEAPATYKFMRGSESTVDFSGQKSRILMAGETSNAFTDFDNTTEASLLAMFNHQAGDIDFSDANLNASDKNLRSKSAASYDYFSANASESTQIKATFDGYISSQINEVFANRMIVATSGVAGQIADGSKTRYVNAKGLEYNQAFAKGLLGALMADQMLNNYLSAAVLDESENRQNNDNGVTETNKPYTTMEHKWDEAYGYLYGTSANPENPNLTIGEDDKFLNEYVGRVNDNADFATIAADIWDAFKLGRAAIVAKNYEVRDAQAAIIREKVSIVIAARGIYYLQAGKNKIADGNREGAFHALSEAYGFVYSLRFTRKSENATPLFTRAEVDTLLSMLLNSTDNGFWDIAPETLDEVSEAMAAKFDFTVAQAATN
ncbi:DUF4856 domain-containing protein [Aequorivita lipolytica]|uniref:DUF4856 domain-containing protein n=1 Tax=Aequorivita lipolytica TaxID=153267 RepID=A0A5C6YM62_9FLAO|nr:DUF4856 domain-containing protein [Aequorivita lipolytica]TXD68317.1 DUF4856 domain-containing protein [Aequorivita lipolytica]SRX53413.1 hypothetical protein AEQU2_02643 [Aequorivita lipolytica]